MNEVEALIGWLREAPDGGCPVEDCGATALLAAISGTQVSAVMHFRGPKELSASEQRQLQAPGDAVGHARRGTLYAGNVPAAAITAVLIPYRLPHSALEAIGTASFGTALGDSGVPLGRALAGLGVRREPLEVLATPGQRDAAGREQVAWSAARLWLGSPFALVTECFFREFLDAYPGPWTLPSAGPPAAP